MDGSNDVVMDKVPVVVNRGVNGATGGHSAVTRHASMALAYPVRQGLELDETLVARLWRRHRGRVGIRRPREQTVNPYLIDDDEGEAGGDPPQSGFESRPLCCGSHCRQAV